MKFFAKKKEETTRCVCVITSHAAQAAVVRTFDRDGSTAKPVVLFSSCQPIHARHGRDEKMLNEIACGALRAVAESCRKFHGNFDEIICTIGEPWTTTFARSVHMDRAEPFKITKKVLDELIVRDRKLFEIEMAQTGTDVGLVQISQPLVDINGYRTADFAGQKSRVLDAHVAYSIADAGFMDELSGVFVDVFHHADVTFKSMDIARAGIVPETMNGTVIEWGGISSVIAIINHGVPKHYVSIPMGLCDFEEHIIQLFAISKNRVDAVMNFASDEKLLQHERDEYYRRIEMAYAPIGILIERATGELRRQLGTIPGHAQVVGIPKWLDVIAPLIEKSAGMTVSDANNMYEKITYAHGTVQNPILTMAVVGAIEAI